jgi:hypothetical protein
MLRCGEVGVCVSVIDFGEKRASERGLNWTMPEEGVYQEGRSEEQQNG